MKRPCAIVNMDFANDRLIYKAAIDVRELISLETVMDDESLNLGPNGGLIYCMEFLIANISWLTERLNALESTTIYVLFDFPGQVSIMLK